MNKTFKHRIYPTVEQGFPLESRKNIPKPYVYKTQDEIYKELKKSRTSGISGKCDLADNVISELREQYDL